MNWSQKRLSLAMRTTQAQVSKLEQGRIDFRVSTLYRLAAVLDVDPEYFFKNGY